MIREIIKKYYKEKFDRYGPTSKGVDWKDRESQILRFDYLFDLINSVSSDYNQVSLLDVGSGYGELLSYLQDHIDRFSYTGIEMVEGMYKYCQDQYSKSENVDFQCVDFMKYDSEFHYDFVVASGIFNVKGQLHDEIFYHDVSEIIGKMYEMCEIGIVFNMMTPVPDFKNQKLFYPDMSKLMQTISKLSRKVHIITSFPLYEITVGVFK